MPPHTCWSQDVYEARGGLFGLQRRALRRPRKHRWHRTRFHCIARARTGEISRDRSLTSSIALSLSQLSQLSQRTGRRDGQKLAGGMEPGSMT
eukprot:195826-Chlamydomonas_euryale.AAC.1